MREKQQKKVMYWKSIQEMYFRHTPKVTPSRKPSWQERIYWKIHFKLRAIKIRRQLRKSMKRYDGNFSSR